MTEKVFVCAGCGLLEVSSRRNACTCSPACRVRAQRNGYWRIIKTIKAMLGDDVTAAGIQQATAIKLLCPELMPQIMAGTLTLEDAQPEAYREFIRLLFAEVDAQRQAAP
jgi:hypothetical protein